VVHESEQAELTAVVDIDSARAQEIAGQYGARALTNAGELAGLVQAAIVAAPTTAHEELGSLLMEAGIDVLVEKPIAPDLAAASRLIEAAGRNGRILQIGHLERFNPAVIELERRATLPLFFEIHRMNVFSPRSLDVDVVLDLMIHDVDIVLALAKAEAEEIRAAGVHVLSEKVDIANVRMQFPNGCVANLTASRVSTERVRKLRLFQPHEYISLDYSRQDAVRFRVSQGMKIDFAPLAVAKDEPLRLELESFIESVVLRREPRVTGEQALAALDVACAILVKIEEHSRLVAETVAETGAEIGKAGQRAGNRG
jgi:predicted dehydrogenase